MKRITAVCLVTVLTGLLFVNNIHAQSKGPMDPMSVDDMTIGLSVGAGTPMWGNGAGVFFGASYFFNRNLGVNGEIGYNSTYANIGVIYKLN